MKLSRHVYVVFFLSFSSIFATDVAQATKDVRLFATAPAPELLARILFPPKTRSLKDQPSQADDNNRLFGLMVNFRFDSSEIPPESEPLLHAVGTMMRLEAVDDRAIVIEGHTDAIGPDAYNESLSKRRAQSIARYLQQKYEIAPHRLVAVGKGEKDLFNVKVPTSRVNRRAMFRSQN